MPAAPSVEALAESFPALQRPFYAQALALANAQSPALRACACAILCSLLNEGFAARDDARIIAARLAALLGRPSLGVNALGVDLPASLAHSQSIAQVRETLEQTTERSISAWPAGLAAITAAIVSHLSAADGPWLAVGPTAALCVLYGPADSRFSLTISHPDALAARFVNRFPSTCVLAEADLEPSGAFSLLKAYAALPFQRFISVSRSAELLSFPGFSRETYAISVAVNAPLVLTHQLYVQSTLASPPYDYASESSVLTLYVWKRAA